MKWVWAAAVVALGACREKPAAKAPHELRVPLPDGWVATGSNERLFAGPRGTTVVSFESKLDELPDADALVAAVNAQKVTGVQTVVAPGFVGARYAVEGQDAFVGVKQVGARTVWCASLQGASDAEVATGFTVCRDIDQR